MYVFCCFDDYELQIKNDYESDLRGNENYLSSGENTGFNLGPLHAITVQCSTN